MRVANNEEASTIFNPPTKTILPYPPARNLTSSLHSSFPWLHLVPGTLPSSGLCQYSLICHEDHPSTSFPSPVAMYVRQDKLPGLKEYKYSSVDRSLLSKYVLKPFYTNFVIKCFPMSMAPNLITLTGFMFVVVNFCTLLWYNPTLDQDCPSWVYYSWAIGLFLYQTFDAVDGTQA